MSRSSTSYRTNPAPPAWAAPIAQWCDGLTVSASTLRSYRTHVVWLAHQLADRDPWDVTGPVLRELFDVQLWAQATRNRVVVSWRSFYAWAVAMGHVRLSPVAGLGSRQRPGPRRQDLPAAWRDLDVFLTHLQAGGRTPATIAVRRDHLVNLSRHLGDPWAATSDDLATWLSVPGLAPDTRRGRLSSVRLFYRWAVRTGRLERDPAQDLAPVRVPRALPKPIITAALRSALAAADDRQRLVLLLAALAGLRRAEIAALTFEDVQTSVSGQAQLRIRGKGGHDRLVPLHPDLEQLLAAERSRRQHGHHGTGWSGPYLRPGGPVFPSSQTDQAITPRYLADVVRPLLPDAWTLHTLRHRFATQAYAAERDLRTVQELLGHSKPEVTARYAAVPDAAKRTAVAALTV